MNVLLLNLSQYIDVLDKVSYFFYYNSRMYMDSNARFCSKTCYRFSIDAGITVTELFKSCTKEDYLKSNRGEIVPDTFPSGSCKLFIATEFVSLAGIQSHENKI